MELSSAVKVNFNYFCGFQIVSWASQTPAQQSYFLLANGWREKRLRSDWSEVADAGKAWEDASPVTWIFALA
jgi:hypothetical protein